jgi:serine/threonine protein kinase
VIPAPDIPGHTVIGVLGSGGFATVYRTWQVAVGRETAVKVDSRALHSERDQRRFFREVAAAGRLSGHPHVIDVNIVQANPTVQALCSAKVLLASRTGAALQVPQSAWSIQVMPPDEAAYDTGVRTVRCLAGHGLDELNTPQFGP